MAIDANVLINERIREELRNGAPPQAAIPKVTSAPSAPSSTSNITTLIAGMALLIFGSGPVRGFAVVHRLGILTSIFRRSSSRAPWINLDLRSPKQN